MNLRPLDAGAAKAIAQSVSDLEALLPPLAGEEWTNLRFAALRRTFRAHLVQRGASAQWDFFHAQARAAAERWALADPEARKSLRLAIANPLQSRPAANPLRETEHWTPQAGWKLHYPADYYLGVAEDCLPGGVDSPYGNRKEDTCVIQISR
jgi:hypothetical protein